MIKKIALVFENLEEVEILPKYIQDFNLISRGEERNLYNTFKYIDKMNLTIKDTLPNYEKIIKRLQIKDIAQICIDDTIYLPDFEGDDENKLETVHQYDNCFEIIINSK